MFAWSRGRNKYGCIVSTDRSVVSGVVVNNPVVECNRTNFDSGITKLFHWIVFKLNASKFVRSKLKKGSIAYMIHVFLTRFFRFSMLKLCSFCFQCLTDINWQVYNSLLFILPKSWQALADNLRYIKNNKCAARWTIFFTQ